MNLKPLRSGVLLKATEAPESSIAGLIIASAISNQATVIAVGPDVKELKVNDIVRYDVQAAVKLESYLLCREADVLCVIEDN